MGACGLLLLLLLSTLLLAASLHPADALLVQAEFNQRGVRGTIVFSQSSPTSNTTIAVNLTGLDQLPGQNLPWHVHQYPFPLGIENPCRVEITGGHFDPLGANARQGENYTENCRVNPEFCEMGDLSGKFGFLSENVSVEVFEDPFLSLFGVFSVIGRSVVIHFSNGDRFVCANIGYPDSDNVEILYTPFRRLFAGNIYFRQHTTDFTSSVFVDLVRTDDTTNSQGHNWHVHEFPVTPGDSSCSSAGGHYNPRNVTVDAVYLTMCNSTAQDQCEIGDLSNKGAPLDVENRVAKLFYTDTDLPLQGGEFEIADRSVVIHNESRTAPRISCANIAQFQPLEAVAFFNEDGVSGSIRFSQDSPFDETEVSVDLTGLRSLADGYHVHEFPVGPAASGSERCSSEFTGGHWNPLGVVYSVNVSRITSDQFEIGDLSGKFGGFLGIDTISENFSDPNIPLSGPNSILGRSIVIHYENTSRWLCANIEFTTPVVRFSATLNTSAFSGRITFLQPANNPFAETVIVVEADVEFPLSPAVTTTLTPTQPPLTLTQLPPPSSPFTSSTSEVATIAPTRVPLTTSFIPAVTSTPVPTPSSDSSGMLNPESGDVFTTVPILTLPSPTPSPSPTSGMMGRRRRRAVEKRNSPGQYRARHRRQTVMMGFNWSIRTLPVGVVEVPDDCTSLPVYDPFMSPSSPSCSPSTPLACSPGDLTGKHGPLQSGRAVFSDPSLPLSGPDSVLSGGSPVLLLQLLDSDTPAACALVRMDTPTAMLTMVPPTTAPPTAVTTTPSSSVEVTMATSTSATPSSAPPPPPQSSEKDNTALVIGAAAGGVVGAILLVAIIIIVIVCCWKCRGGGYDMMKSMRRNKDNVELGAIRPAKPKLGVPTYRAVYNYSPHNEGDLSLTKGDWVTLIEAPYGGEWWRGSVEEKEGWFPKSYVEYVDIEAERKRQEEENFKLAAAAIIAASSTFSTRHGSLSKKKTLATGRTSPAPARTHTISKQNIDSTPTLVRRLGVEPQTEVEVIENVGRDNSSPNVSRPDTPRSTRSAEVIQNKAALEGPSNQGTPLLAARSQHDNHEYASPLVVMAAVHREPQMQANIAYGTLSSDKYLVKYDFSGSTEIELPLTRGSIVTVMEKADNGWWKGVSEGRVGWFPETYVKVASVEAIEVPASMVQQPRRMEEMMEEGSGDLEVTEYRAIQPFQSALEGDLTFSEGDTVLVYWADDSGWWFGAANSEQGWFPGSFVEPIVDVSEAGSMAASPTPGEAPLISGQSEATASGGGLAGEFAAAVKTRKASREKTEGEKESLKKKKWSFKRKDKRNVSGSSAQGESVTSPQQGIVGLEDELASAITQHSLAGGEEVGGEMTIDEKVALLKERRASEEVSRASRSELIATFLRRSLKRKPTQDQEPVTATREEVTPQMDEAVEIEVAQPRAETEPQLETTEVTVEVVPHEESESAHLGGGGGETTEQERGEGTAETRQEGEGEEGAVQAEGPATPSTVAKHKPRRRAPPPPAISPLLQAASATPPSTPTQTGKPATPTPSTPTSRRPITPTPSTPTSRPPITPTKRERTSTTPAKTATTPTRRDRTATTPSKVKKSATTKPAPSPKPRPIISSPVLQTEIQTIPKSYTMAGPHNTPPSTKPRTSPKKRTRLDSKPRRPPPPTPQAKAGVPLRPIHTLEAVTEDTDSVFVETPITAALRSQKPEAKSETQRPIAAPRRMKPRVQRVKRPLRRNIPPPPSIPLPPPPSRQKVLPAEDSKAAKPASKPKPAVLPKPAHLTQIVATQRRRSQPSVSNQEDEAKSADASRMVSRGPRPPPPARTSSLSEMPAFMTGEKPSPLPSISDTTEETDSVVTTHRVPRTEPPKYPPPPRPLSRVEEPDGHRKRRSEPPLHPPPPRPASAPESRSKTLPSTHGKTLYDASTEEMDHGEQQQSGASSILKKGSSLMRSLKRMVKGDPTKSKGDEGTTTKSIPPPRPDEPPKVASRQDTAEASTQNGAPATQTNTSQDPPVPKPRTDILPPSKEEESREEESNPKQLPSRPPPPNISKPSETKAKEAPSRPPPPKLQTNIGKEAQGSEKPQSPEENEVERTEDAFKPVPFPRRDLDTRSQGSSEGELPSPTRSTSSSPRPLSSPIESARTPTNFYRATKSYTAQRDTELSFSAGDILIQIDCPSDDFYYGMLDDGSTGLFPASFVEPFYSPTS